MIQTDGSLQRAVAVTPNDSADLAIPSGFTGTRGVYVGAAGNLAVTMGDGSSVTFTGLAAGVIHPLDVKRILATGTTATNIIVLY